ncbi:MAG: fructose-bisphosphatase class II [Myxococcota bacterium]
MRPIKSRCCSGRHRDLPVGAHRRAYVSARPRASCALRCALGGEIQGQPGFRNDAERERAKAMGIEDPDKIFDHRTSCSRTTPTFVATAKVFIA